MFFLYNGSAFQGERLGMEKSKNWETEKDTDRERYLKKHHGWGRGEIEYAYISTLEIYQAVISNLFPIK